MTENIIEAIRENVIQGRVNIDDEGLEEGTVGQPGVTELIEEALTSGISVTDIINQGLTAAMGIVGRKYENEEYYIPDMLASAECVGAAMDILSPHLTKAGIESKGKFIISTVEGDLHDIGKNIVSIMLKGAGYEVIDLGADVATDKIIQTVKEHQAPFLGLSALLTTTMRVMGDVIEQLKKTGLRDGVKVFIGGAPTSDGFAQEIGADAHCKDAFQAIEIMKSMAA